MFGYQRRERRQEEIASLVQDREQRKEYAGHVFLLVVLWLAAVGMIVLMHGAKNCAFALSTTVLTTLIGSTTASVLGLFAIVANYLFPKR